MKVILFDKLKFIAASHEDSANPGSYKKILFHLDDFIKGGRIQMINWANIPVGKDFREHLHEDMDEIFIIISGKGKIAVEEEVEILNKGDSILIPMNNSHKMINIGDSDLEYLAIGISLGRGGKTVLKNKINLRI